MHYLRLRGRIAESVIVGGLPQLTEVGRREAETIVRSHHLWKQYLVTKVDVAEERLHAQADQLEHFTNRELQDQLDEQTDSPSTDPRGRRIPNPDAGDSASG